MMSYDSSGTPDPKPKGSFVPGMGGISASWLDAVASLISSRIGIIRIESQDAIDVVVRKLILLGVAMFTLFATWGLLTAGLIGVIADHFKCPWYFAAFSMGGFYLLISLVMMLIIKRTRKTVTFPVTRAEFEKDRQWLNQIKNR